MKPLVGIIMGSTSDWETLQVRGRDARAPRRCRIEVRVVSAHRTPDLLFEYAATARDRGLEVIIAGAGGAAHLPGMTASKTSLPVLGVPVQSKALNGLDSLLSIVQMPAGIPVGTLAIGAAGATNAALLAAAILANKHPDVRAALDTFRAAQTEQGARRSRIRASPPSQHERSASSAPASSGACWRWPAIRSACASVPRSAARTHPAGRSRRSSRARSTIADCLARLAAGCDVVTFEFENVPVDGACSGCRQSAPCHPPVEALRVSQDRLHEKAALRAARDRHTPPFARSTRCASSRPRWRAIGLPGVLKTRRLGYDGKGQRTCARAADLDAALGGARRRAAASSKDSCDFDREVSIIGARSTRGRDPRSIRSRQHVHRDGILRVTRAPHRTPALQRAGGAHLKRLLEHFDYAGVLTIEFFVRARPADRQRDGAARAQLRALDHRGRGDQPVREPPAGDPRPAAGRHRALGHCGDDQPHRRMPARDALLRVPGVHFTTTAKTPRPGRKLGHCTLVSRHGTGPRPPDSGRVQRRLPTADRTCCPSTRAYDRL